MTQFDILLDDEPIAFVIAKNKDAVMKHIVVKQFKCKKGTARFGTPIVLEG